MMRYPQGPAAETIRVLIIDDVIDVVHTLRSWLKDVEGVQIVGAVTDPHEGISIATKRRPDIVLLDVRMDKLDGYQTALAINEQVMTRIILMSGVVSNEEMKDRALAVGARGYLAKPMTRTELIEKIFDVASMPLPRDSAERLSAPPVTTSITKHKQFLVGVCGTKGGVGTSNIAANLAVSLAQEGAGAVALVDANHLQGNLHVLFKIEPKNTSSIDALRDQSDMDAELIQQVAIHHPSGVAIFRAPVPGEVGPEPMRGVTMRAILVELREHFDYVIVDMQPTFTETMQAIMEQANRLLLVTTLEVTAIERTSAFLLLAQEHGISMDRCLLLSNRVDGGYQIKPEHVERHIMRRFVARIPNDTHVVNHAVNHGNPFVMDQRRSGVTRAIQQFGQRLRKDLEGQGTRT